MEDGPKPLGSGRPERYEIDDTVSNTPSNYTLLKAFDASHIFSKHPHKYDKLVAQEDGYSKDDSAFSDSEITVVSRQQQYQSSAGVPRQRARSNSLTSIDVSAMENALSTLENPKSKAAADLDTGEERTTSNRADCMHRRCSLDHMADYYSRRSSDAAVSTIWDPAAQASGSSSMKSSVETAVAAFIPNKPKVAEVFGEKRLTAIMMKAAFEEPFKAPLKPKAKEVLEVNQPPSSLKPPKPAKVIMEDLEVPHTSQRRVSLPETTKDMEMMNMGESVGLKTSTVYPKPRRLFGIGPMYHPLPETVVEGVTSHDGPLTNRIKKEGLVVGKECGAPVKKAAPTKAEMNSWAPFSM